MKKSNKITKESAMKALEMLETRLYAQHYIAAVLGVNQGRISEIKNGKYDHLISA
jgi:predicted XRE-type DNA-binding protein